MKLYTIYHIGCTIPGSDVYTNTFEIYNDASDFLDSLENYIEYAKSCLCDVDEDNPDQLAEWFEECGYNEQAYVDYLRLVENVREGKSKLDALYNVIFEGFDIDIQIILTTTDHVEFIRQLYIELSDRHDLSPEMDTEELVDICVDYPEVRYLSGIVESKVYPSEDAFVSDYQKYEMSINEYAKSLQS